jgi:predicted GNAT family N-acyltransferase
LAECARARLRVEVLGGGHDRQGFSCGVPDVDTYIRDRAGQDAKRHIATTFVLLEDCPRVLGYYTLSQQVISLEHVSAAMARKLPRYPMLPATLIGRLAVDGARQGEGLGGLLLVDALFRSWQTAQTVAYYAVRVDATDERARDFYLRYDFLPFPKERLKLFFPMADLDRLYSSEA